MSRRHSIAFKFLLTYLAVAGAAFLAAGVSAYFHFRDYALAEVRQTLTSDARMAAEIFRPLIAGPPADLKTAAALGDRLRGTTDVRITMILPNGTVAADSSVGSVGLATMENHLDRPEVQEAFAGRVGASIRHSITLADDEQYVAVPIVDGGKTIGVARTAIPLTRLTPRLRQVRTILWGAGLSAFFGMLLLTAWRANKLAGPLDEIRAATRELSAGNLAQRAEVRTGDELEEIATSINGMSSRLGSTIAELDAQKSRLSALVENLAEGVVVIGDDRAVRLANAGAESLLDSPAGARTNRPYTETIRNPEVLAFIDGWFGGHDPTPREIVLRGKPHDRTVRVSATRVRHESLGATDLLVTLRDVTEERRLARIKSDFVSNASHELRTPLTNVRGYLEAMDDSLKAREAVDPSHLAVALGNTLRMQALIDDLLVLSKAESGSAALHVDEVSLRSFVDAVLGRKAEAAAKAGKTLRNDAPDVTIFADAEKLEMAVSNLVDNAVKYGKANGTVTVTGGTTERESEIAVSDDGPGISSEHLPRIFERFYRVDAGRSRDLGGTGLGLSIVKHIVESHAGTLSVESALGVGSTFRIRLPR